MKEIQLVKKIDKWSISVIQNDKGIYSLVMTDWNTFYYMKLKPYKTPDGGKAPLNNRTIEVTYTYSKSGRGDIVEYINNNKKYLYLISELFTLQTKLESIDLKYTHWNFLKRQQQAIQKILDTEFLSHKKIVLK